MDSTMDGVPTVTLPHHPTYGVELTDESIAMLVKESMPGLNATLRISRFAEGMSFNNKIYRIDIDHNQTKMTEAYILKVNGRFWGPAKVENEVSCLLLLRHFCPEIPAPKLIAWSTDGSQITKYSEDEMRLNSSKSDALEAHKLPGWVLMTCLPGARLNAFKLSPEEKSDMAVQIANVLATWRQKLPKSRSCANLHLAAHSAETANASLYNSGAAPGLEFHVYGFVGYGNDDCPPITTLLEYWKTELEWHINKLASKPDFAPNREALLPILRELMRDVLPELPLLKGNELANFVFTHADFFPRNILVQGSPPQITGIVDFEFAGFSPPMEEFVQTWLPNDDPSDWPTGLFDDVLKELERRGESTPNTLDRDTWFQIKNLSILRNHIAPWWLEDVDESKADDTANDLRHSRKRVQEAVDTLTEITNVHGGHRSLQ